MRYLRCKCGYRQAWSSLGSRDCDVCEKCGSTLAEAPGLHHDPIPHDFVTKYDQDTGDPYLWCRRCGKKAEVEKS